MDADNEKSSFSVYFHYLEQKYLYYIDWATLYLKSRWMGFLFLFTFCCWRIIALQGFYVVLYILAIHLLSLFIGFISPQVDSETNTYILPIREIEEYRPFQRSLSEFNFWLYSTRATLIAIVSTCFPFLDIPVFWPVLFIYFIFLMIVTLKEQIKQMKTYGYLPFSWGKKIYGDIPSDKFKTSKFLNPFGRKSEKPVFPSIHNKKMIHSRID